MNVTVRTPRMTREQFLDWVERQEAPYEFDGFEPVAITRENRNHNRLCRNLIRAVGNRFQEGPCELLGEAGLNTIAMLFVTPTR